MQNRHNLGFGCVRSWCRSPGVCDLCRGGRGSVVCRVVVVWLANNRWSSRGIYLWVSGHDNIGVLVGIGRLVVNGCWGRVVDRFTPEFLADFASKS